VETQLCVTYKQGLHSQPTGVSSCGVERGEEARFGLNLIPELRSKSQIFTGLSLSG